MDDLDLKEAVDIFDAVTRVGADKNPLGDRAQLIARGVRCNIHRGTSQAQQEATILGLDGTLAATGYFNVDSYRYLAIDRLLQTPSGEAFLISSIPSLRNRFPETAHVRCLLMLQQDPMPGLALIESVWVGAGASALSSEVLA